MEKKKGLRRLPIKVIGGERAGEKSGLQKFFFFKSG